MSSPVLVAYATRYGSTKEVAEAVGTALRDCGLGVDILPARDVQTLAGYRMVVLGAPLYMFHWHKDALGFLARHRDALASLPVAVFALGPFHDKAEEWQEVRSELDKELAKYPWLKPKAIQIVGGKFDPERLDIPWRWLPALRKMPPADIRDWEAIGAWATGLAAMFEPALREEAG